MRRKRHGNLFPGIVSFGNLFAAAKKALRGRSLRMPGVMFLADLEPEVVRLARELRNGDYRPGEYHSFEIFEPKQRVVAAAPFRDRVVHHAICRVIEPLWERRLIADTYACRLGKGTHAGVRRAAVLAQQHPWVLCCDIRQYFPSVSHFGPPSWVAPVGRGYLSDGWRTGVEGERRSDRLVSWAPGRQLEQQRFQLVVLQPQHERPVEREQQHRFSSRKPLQADSGPIWWGPVEPIRRPLHQQCLVSGTTPVLPCVTAARLRAHCVGQSLMPPPRPDGSWFNQPWPTAGCGGGAFECGQRQVSGDSTEDSQFTPNSRTTLRTRPPLSPSDRE